MQDLDIPALKRTFDEDGFVVLRGYVRPPELDVLKSRVVRLIERTKAKVAEHEQYAAVRKSLEAHDPWAHDYLHKGPHLPLIEALVEDTPVPASFGSFHKRAGEQDGVSPHYDAIGASAAPNFAGVAGATMWIALDPASLGNGCLYYLRGSHKLPFAPKVGLDIDAHKADAVAMQAAAGDAFIHNARTVHWSGDNQTGAPRRAVAMFYWSAGAAEANKAAIGAKLKERLEV